MLTNFTKERLIETSSLARRLYGVKLLLSRGLTDESKWFLMDRERLKYSNTLNPTGLVVDIGAYLGDFTAKLSDLNPDMSFKLYEPIPEFSKKCLTKFSTNKNVEVFPFAVTADGRELHLHIDGPRTKIDISQEHLVCSSLSVTDVFRELAQVELLKMNIEGAEYECLFSLIESGDIYKINYLLIQFHDFKSSDVENYSNLIHFLEKDFVNLFRYKWIWEMWKIKS